MGGYQTMMMKLSWQNMTTEKSQLLTKVTVARAHNLDKKISCKPL